MSDTAPASANPDEPKPDEKADEPPKTFMEKIGAALPIGLTALATVFAGMSTSALQQAMYWKSQAGQDQSKATNQWTHAGFKVDRSLAMQTAAAQLAVVAAGKKPDLAPSNDPTSRTAAEWLGGKGPPEAYRRGASETSREGKVGLPDIPSPALNELLDLIRKRAPEDELLRKAARVPLADINKAIDDAEAGNEKITEQEWSPIVSAARKMVSTAREKETDPAKIAAGQAALFELEQRRYRSEATLNQELASLYEGRVKVTSAESDKHRRKSQTLFIAMLVAQIGGVVSSLALARQKKSMLWFLAATAGLIALGFGAYVVLDF